tara:strand:- start:506 stop:1075 length:570 start_codon:yes stop_codon:yes gene_type:complete
MTVTYVPTEDRMMLRIATSEKTEYRLWLTRRFVATLWPALGGQLAQTADLSGLRPQSTTSEPPAGASEAPPPPPAVPTKVRDAVLGMEHQAAVQESDFSRKHDEDTVDLTANTGPMIVTGAKVKPWDGKKLVLGFQTSNDMNVTVTLDKKLLHGFCHMVATTVQKAEWGLALTVGEPVAAPQADTKVIH